ncbi:hypothetical protein ACHQM5_015637 [Ranunculus cassubicifolius]
MVALFLIRTSLSSLPPSPPPCSTRLSQINGYEKGGSNNDLQEEESGGLVQEADYGVFDPAPVIFPGTGAPIPH